MIFSFLHPEYLLLLLIIPFFFLIHLFSLENKKKFALKFANFNAISKIEGVDFFSRSIVPLFLNLLIFLLIVLSVSGFTLHVSRQSSSFSFVLTIDNSQSMLADDFSPSRLAVAKQVAKNFVDIVPGISIGVVSFSGNSVIEQGMTQDKNEIKSAIDNIELSGVFGTDLYEAIITSANLLKGEENKAIILLSDGQINVGTIDQAVDYAIDEDVIIHTIAMGTKGGGRTDYSISKLDEDSLRSISYMTGGNYSTVETQQALTQSFAEILKITKKRVSIDTSGYLILIAIILFAIKFFLDNTKYFYFP